MRFRAEQHLRRPADIRAVRELGRRIDCRAFTVWWKKRDTAAPPTNSSPPPRVCVIASTKAVGSAVERNRARRRLREVFRHQQHLVPAHCDLLLIARDTAKSWPIGELENAFADACRRIESAASSQTIPAS